MDTDTAPAHPFAEGGALARGADVTVVTSDGVELFLHRVILGMWSDFFQDLCEAAAEDLMVSLAASAFAGAILAVKFRPTFDLGPDGGHKSMLQEPVLCRNPLEYQISSNGMGSCRTSAATAFQHIARTCSPQGHADSKSCQTDQPCKPSYG